MNHHPSASLRWHSRVLEERELACFGDQCFGVSCDRLLHPPKYSRYCHRGFYLDYEVCHLFLVASLQAYRSVPLDGRPGVLLLVAVATFRTLYLLLG